MTPPLLEVENLSVSFLTEDARADVVRNISFDVAEGETLVIVGESGSGKSITASTIMDLLDCPPAEIRSGRILFRGRDLLTMEPPARRAIAGKQIAMIFQDPLAHLHPLYTIGAQIAECFTVHGACSAAEAWERTVHLLHRVGIPDPERRARQYPHQFSGGQRQRVMIAMALSLQPALLIADEPTTALDVTVQNQILELLRELSGEFGMSLILITHDLGVAANMGDRVLVMKAGEIIERGPSRTIFEHPTHAYTRRLLAATLTGDGPEKPPATERVLLRVRHLTKDYYIPGGLRGSQTIRAVRDVGFEIRAGETVAIVGESGSGKSSIARLLMRLEEPTGGDARYDGEDIFAMRGTRLLGLRRRMQMIFQDPYSSLNPRMSIGQIISEPWTVHADILPKSARAGRLAELLSLVGLEPEHARRYPHEFSGGQRQRVAIARALASDPELVICDEAVSALDVSIQAQVIDLLSSLREKLGLAYLFISHDLGVVRHFASRVLVMQAGQVVEQGSTHALFTNPKEAYTRNLLTAAPQPKWLLPDKTGARAHA